MIGLVIRNFFHDLFGSRMVTKLETDILTIRQDFNARLQEKDAIIADLKEEIGLWRNRLEIMTSFPFNTPKTPQIPTFETSYEETSAGSWQKTQEDYYKQQEAEIAAQALAAAEKAKQGEIENAN